MFLLLPNDIIYTIICNLTNIYDVINLSSINKNTHELFDDSLYLYWGRNLYTKEFWDKAELRTPMTCTPYINMKTELLRIEIFQTHLIKHGMEIWDKEDFYKYWEVLEKYISNRGTPPNPRVVGCTHHINRAIPDGGVGVPPTAFPLIGGYRVSLTNEEIFSALYIL